jgi:thiol-disulfide isomerase/thioredoxin
MWKQDPSEHAESAETWTEGRGSRIPWLLIGLAVLVGLFSLLVQRLQPSRWAEVGAAHPSVGRPLSHLRLEPMINTSSAVALNDLQGEVVLINYWGPWCGPCRMEMPSLIALEKRYANNDRFRMLSVSCGLDSAYRQFSELHANTIKFVDEKEIRFGVYFDPNFESRKTLANDAELSRFSYPTTVLLDGDQIIRGLWIGYAPELGDEIDAVLEGVLAQ